MGLYHKLDVYGCFCLGAPAHVGQASLVFVAGFHRTGADD